jgi:hypothetical protein
VTPSASVCNRASGARPRARESVPAAPAQLTFRGRATTPYALLVVEPEFASVLRQTTREINTLSPGAALRWDGRPLALLTRTVPARASDAHINPIGRAVAMRALDFGRELSPSVVFAADIHPAGSLPSTGWVILVGAPGLFRGRRRE